MAEHSSHPALTSARGRGSASKEQRASLATEPPAPDVPASLPLEHDTDADRLARLLEGFGSVDGFSARVERLRAPGMPESLTGYLGSLGFSDDFLEDVRQEFGGGRFRARIYDARGQYKTSFPFAIAGAPKRPDSTAAPVGVGPASAAGESRLERLLESLASTVATLTETVVRGQAAARNPDDELERTLKLVRAMRELNPPPAPAPAADPLATLNTMLEVQAKLDEIRGEGGDDKFGKILEHGVKPIAGIMTRSLDLQEKALMLRTNPNARRAVPVPQPEGAPIGDAAPLEGGTDPVVLLAAQLPGMARGYLANAARRGLDPETYAIMALDLIQEHNPAAYEALPSMLERDDFVSTLLAAVPEWQGAPEWFAQLGDCLRAQFADDASDTDATTGPDDPPADAAA